MTSIFRGRQSLRLDSKGRMILPKAFRPSSPSAAKKFFITNNIYQGRTYLELVPEKDWLLFEKKVLAMPHMKSEVQAFRRFYLASAFPVQVDSQWRLLVPPELRQFAKLSDNVVLLGVGHKIEIWCAEVWEGFQRSLMENYDQVLSEVAHLEGVSA